jgi:acyl-CoA reductase-like NAD-dependent aldehyde dehydrogenase
MIAAGEARRRRADLKRSRAVKDARLFIGGEWIASRDKLPVLDKFSCKAAAQASVADQALVTKAVDAALDAFRSKEILIPDRYDILMRAARILERRRDEFVEVMVTETGFTPPDNLGDLQRCIRRRGEAPKRRDRAD